MPRELIEKLWQRGREFLGVELPVMGGAMSWISESNLVAAISNAGAFGVLAGGNMPPEMLKEEIRRTADQPDRPCGVNLITIAPNFRSHLDHVLDIGLPFVILAGGLPPREAIARIKQTGSRLLCFAPTVGIARSLLRGGVDALIIEGHEAGGHIGPISTAVLAEQILPRIHEVPVFVAGGIGSGVMMVHYLMMGAAGVQLGLVAQIERKAISVKEAALKLEEFWIGALRRAVIDGDVTRGSVMAGQSVGRVKDIMPVRQILEHLIDEAVAEAEQILKRLER